MSRHISTLNYLWLAATCLTRTRTVIYWLSAPAIRTVQTNATLSVVISTKNRWRPPKLGTDSSLKFPCCRLVTNKQYVTSSRLINHVTWLRQTNPLLMLGYVCFTASTEKSRILFVQPAMLKNRTILSLDQRIEVLCRLGEAHHVDRLLPSRAAKCKWHV